MKKLIVIGIVLVCIGLMYLYPHAMLNPGELVEGHQKLNDKCISCHNPFLGVSNDKCILCHKLSDIGKDTFQLNETVASNQKGLFHQYLSNQKCTSCHTDHKGIKPEMSLNGFDHEMLPVTIIGNCNGCHEQPSDNLHKQLATTCKDCHNTIGWKSSMTFNHDMIQGDTRNNCTSCHPKPEDSFHQQIKDNCNKCHSVNQWKPSTFDHSTYFLLDGDHKTECNTCHINNNFNAFTCYGCHEHSESNIREEHTEHGIYNFANCASCHRSGNEHDIRTNDNSNQELNQNELSKVNKNNNSQERDKKKEQKNREDDDD